MPEPGSSYFFLFAFLVLISSFISASAGFGFAIIMIAFLQFFMGTVELVGMIYILGLFGCIFRVIETRRVAKWRQALRLIVPSLVGVPLGVAILRYLDPVSMQRFLNIALLASVVMLVYFMRNPQKTTMKNGMTWFMEPLVGFISGFLGGSCALPGPPVVIWGVLKGWKKIEMHAIWARFFLALTIFSLFNLTLRGMYTHHTVINSLLTVPVVAVGFVFGTWTRNRITEERFRLYVFAFLFLSGLAGFAMSFR